MATLPHEIRLGAVSYALRERKNLRAQNGTELLGCIRFAEGRIELEKEQAPAMQRVTLLHEVIHAIYEHAGLREHDEQIIDITAYGILAVLRDNPALLAYLVPTE